MGIRLKFWKKKGLKTSNEVNLDQATNTLPQNSLTITNQIKIKIFRSLGGGGLGLAAKFQATERKDEHNNLFAINQETKFKEDLDFTMDKVYTWINTELKLNGKKKSEKIIAVRQKIKDQETILKTIEDDVTENAKRNFLDEEQKLNQLSIFLESLLKKDGRGTYMIQEEGGIRTYYFKVVDGFLFPYFWGENSNRIDPDIAVAKKIYAHENQVFNNEAGKFDKKFQWGTIIMLGLSILFMLVGGWMTFGHTESMYSMAKDVNQGTITCTNTLALCTQNYEILSRKYNLGIENEKNIKKEDINNNKAQTELDNILKKIN